MRHVPIAEFKDRLSEVVAAAEAGEEIVITRHGRDVVKLVAVEQDCQARRRGAIDAMTDFRRELRKKGVQATREEVSAWIAEGRR